MDKNVYLGSLLLKGIDSKSFIVLPEIVDYKQIDEVFETYSVRNTLYIADKNGLFLIKFKSSKYFEKDYPSQIISIQKMPQIKDPKSLKFITNHCAEPEMYLHDNEAFYKFMPLATNEKKVLTKIRDLNGQKLEIIEWDEKFIKKRNRIYANPIVKSTGYFKIGNQIYFYDKVVSNADAKTFIVSSDYVASDKNNEYIRGININEIRNLCKAYKKVSLLGDLLIINNSPNVIYKIEGLTKRICITKEELNNSPFCSIDPKKRYGRCSYHNNICSDLRESINGSGKIIATDDIKKFKNKDNQYSDYGKGSRGIYFYNIQDQKYHLLNANKESFELIGRYYARDNQNVYYADKILDGVNSKKLIEIPTNTKESREMLKANYDSLPVIQDRQKIQIYNQQKYLLTEKSVYVNGKLLNGADPKHFKVLPISYSKDNKNVYYWDKKVEGIDAKTFTILNRSFAQDENHVLCDGRVLPNVKPSFFKLIGDRYAITSNKVFRLCAEIIGADPKTFKRTSLNESEDANFKYSYGKRKARKNK